LGVSGAASVLEDIIMLFAISARTLETPMTLLV